MPIKLKYIWPCLFAIALGMACQNIYAEPTRKTEPKDFELISMKGFYEHGYFQVNLEIKNNGPSPAGVELQLIARDDKGDLVEAPIFYPAAWRNIHPGETVAFSGPLSDRPGIATAKLKAIGVHVFKE